MAVFIELTTDAFQSVFTSQTSSKQSARRAGADSVRRPLRGLEVKSDTYAIIKVIQADGTELPLIDSGSLTGESNAYSNFILQTVQEARMEKHQIVETFGEAYIFFFGEAPRFLDVTAVLVDSNDFNWQAEFWANYDRNLRGSKLVERGARVYLFYNDNVVEGYMLQAQAVNSADNPMLVQLSFRLYLTNYQNISFVGQTSFPIRGGASLPSGVTFDQPLSSDDISQIAQANGVTGFFDTTGAFVPSAPMERDVALRGNISDNIDEWTGEPPATTDLSQSPDTLTEVPDLQQASISQLGAYGADINNPDALASLNLQASFSVDVGVGIGLGASTSATATFGATASVSAGVSIGADLNASFGPVSTVGNGQGSVDVFLENLQAQAAADAAAANQSGFTVGISMGASFGGGVGAGAGATTVVGGQSTCFAFTAVPGTLDNSAQAQVTAQASLSISL